MGRLPFDPEKVSGPTPSGPPAKREARYRHTLEAKQLTVSQVAELIKTTLEQQIPSPLRVVGELGNLKAQNHWYFSLKDDKAVINCVAWASSAKNFKFKPREGDEVVATGHISHFGPQGRTQLYVRNLKPVGEGALDRSFRQMCDELRKLGYFDEARKKPLPTFPRRVAVITSASGAALQDVLHTAAQRCKAVSLLIVDVRVQGDDAASQVADAIRWVDRHHRRLGIDAMIVARGGGSAEDLWAFNERVVADAAYRCELPLVAAIGHESDTTVIELVADVRAATPTQAAVRLIPDAVQLKEQIRHLTHRLTTLTHRGIERRAEHLSRLAAHQAMRDPATPIRRARERAERRALDLRRVMLARRDASAVVVERLAARLGASHPTKAVHVRRQQISELSHRLTDAMSRRANQRHLIHYHQHRLSHAMETLVERRDAHVCALDRSLRSVDPHAVLARGFSYTTDRRGKLLQSVSDVSPGDRIKTQLADGMIGSTVETKVKSVGRRKKGKTGEVELAPGQMDLFTSSQ